MNVSYQHYTCLSKSMLLVVNFLHEKMKKVKVKEKAEFIK